MVQLKAKIVENIEVPGQSWRCGLKIPFDSMSFLRTAKPGQFIDIKINDTLDPFLRRPFSIHKVDVRCRCIWIFYEPLGKGTNLLKAKKCAEEVDIIGPLGNGFDLSPEVVNGRTAILVSGGMGLAPLFFLAERLAKFKVKMLVLLGVRKKENVAYEKEFKKLGSEVEVATDDGSYGFKGRVTELLKKKLSTMDYRLSTIYACGPKPMLKALTQISKQYNIPAQISLESHMACGIGACLGCVVNTSGGVKRVCKDGPVFNAEEIIW